MFHTYLALIIMIIHTTHRMMYCVHFWISFSSLENSTLYNPTIAISTHTTTISGITVPIIRFMTKLTTHDALALGSIALRFHCIGSILVHNDTS